MKKEYTIYRKVRTGTSSPRESEYSVINDYIYQFAEVSNGWNSHEEAEQEVADLLESHGGTFVIHEEYTAA